MCCPLRKAISAVRISSSFNVKPLTKTAISASILISLVAATVYKSQFSQGVFFFFYVLPLYP